MAETATLTGDGEHARRAASGPCARRRRSPARKKGSRAQRRRKRKETGDALVGLLVWGMMGIAVWHFAVFVPDRFWGGIVGAFLAATSARS